MYGSNPQGSERKLSRVLISSKEVCRLITFCDAAATGLSVLLACVRIECEVCRKVAQERTI